MCEHKSSRRAQLEISASYICCPRKLLLPKERCNECLRILDPVRNITNNRAHTYEYGLEFFFGERIPTFFFLHVTVANENDQHSAAKNTHAHAVPVVKKGGIEIHLLIATVSFAKEGTGRREAEKANGGM